MVIGGTASETEARLVLRTAVYRHQGISNMAEAEEEGIMHEPCQKYQ